MNKSYVKYLIIGAGISGLTFANYCSGDYLIVEKETEVGGYCRTIKSGEFVWDYAGHFFHFNTDEFKNKFLNQMPVEDIIYNEKCTKIVHKDRFIDFPFQTNIHQLEKEEFIDCLYDLFQKEEKERYDNFLDMLYGKFGKSIVDKFLKPYNEKLYAIDLKELDVDAMGRFFPYADKEAIIRNMKNSKVNSYNASFLYPKNGAGSFIDILYSSIDKNKVLLETEVVSIDFNNKTASLSDGTTVFYEYLINTSPLNKFLSLSQGYEALIDEMSYNKVLVFNLGFNKKSELCQKEHWLYVADKECNFYRCGFYNNILGQENLSMYIEIGYSKNATVTKEDIDEQLKLTLQNLNNLGITDAETKLVDYSVIMMDPAYVHISTETNKKIDLLKEEFSEINVYTIGRYGAWIYNSMEDSMLKAKELAEKIG
ncbi:MAG: FAD-dependent oxidoreductase [Acutalibacteraceae bacterium]|nr:FAD-dependent oxidoreductase [Acutalibacteraceae bacterium]